MSRYRAVAPIFLVGPNGSTRAHNPGDEVHPDNVAANNWWDLVEEVPDGEHVNPDGEAEPVPAEVPVTTPPPVREAEQAATTTDAKGR